MRGVNFLLFFLLSISPIFLWAQVKGSVDKLYEEGITALHDRDYQLALNKLDEVIYNKPAFDRAYFYRASIKMQLNDKEAALTDYNIYLEWHPEDSEALLTSSILNYQLENYNRARIGFLKLKSLPTGVTNTIFYRQSKYGEGVDRVFTAQTPNQSYILNYLGLVEKGLKDFDEAILYFDSAIYDNPNDPDYYVNRGGTYKDMNRHLLAKRDFEKALQINPDHGLAKNNLASLLELSGDHAAAEAYYSQSIADNPASPYPYRQRGYQRMTAGKLNGALNDLSKAISLEPEEAETWLNRGIVYERMGNTTGAIYNYSHAIDLQPNMSKAYLNRGNALYKLEQYNDALRDYQVALIHDREYALAFYHRGITYYKLGDGTKACKDIQAAIKRGVVEAQKASEKICTYIQP